jgi:NADH-quinone oxidoreductase subunit A
MSLFFFESLKISVFILFSFVLGILIVGASYRLTVSNPDFEKLSAYECGFDPFGDARNTFDIKFYLVAILFIIFDLEALYFYPWCISYSFLQIDSFTCMLDFIFELLIGLAYAWKAGALEW